MSLSEWTDSSGFLQAPVKKFKAAENDYDSSPWEKVFNHWMVEKRVYMFSKKNKVIYERLN